MNIQFFSSPIAKESSLKSSDVKVDAKPCKKEEKTKRVFFSSAQLEQFDQKKVKDFISAKYIGHVFGDSFLAGSSNEGWYAGDAMLHMISLLKEYAKTEEIRKLIPILEQGFEFQSYAYSLNFSNSEEEKFIEQTKRFELKCHEKIFELPIGHSLLIPGGCMGHFVLFEIVKKQDDAIDFVVHNTGEGNEKHWIYIESDGKQKIEGSYVLENISIKELIQNDILNKLIALKKKETNSFGDELYGDILGCFDSKRVGPSKNPENYMRAQRAGTCGWKVLCSFLRYHLPIEQYKYLKLVSRLDIFKKWNQANEPLDIQKHQKELIRKCIINEEGHSPFKAKKKDFSKEELLTLALTKVEKTYQHYHFLLSEQEKEETASWYENLTGRCLYTDWKLQEPKVEKDALRFA